MLLPWSACFKIKRRFKKIALISDELPLCGQLSLSGYFQVPQGWQLRVCVCMCVCVFFFLGGGGEWGVQLYFAIIVNYLRITHPTLNSPSLQSCNGDENAHGEGKKKSNTTLSKKGKCSYLFLLLSGGSLLSLSNPGLNFRSSFSSSLMRGDKLFLNSFSRSSRARP